MPQKDDLDVIWIKKSLRKSVRTRESNLREKKLLDDYMSKLEKGMKKSRYIIYREMKNIEHELELLGGSDEFSRENTPEADDIVAEREQKSVDFCISNTNEANGNAKLKTSEGVNSWALPKIVETSSCKESVSKNRGCMYGATERDCCVFPCVKPQRYSSIGFHVIPRDQLLENQRKRRSNQYKFNTSNDVLKGTYANSQGLDFSSREVALAKLMQDLRAKNMANKPKDRAVKYGEPVPRQKINRIAMVMKYL